jgi:hypothetical protein
MLKKQATSNLKPQHWRPVQPPKPQRADQLVGMGFRCWLAGYQSGDLSSWQHVWSAYSSAIGASRAQGVVTELSMWVRAICLAGARPINVSAIGCPTFCRDECMAISMVAACQRDACPAARACAFALLGHDRIEPTLGAAIDFAEALRDCGELLSETSVCNAMCAIRPMSRLKH